MRWRARRIEPVLTEELARRVIQARVVSCDVFDTALVRSVARPEDVHLITGARLVAAGLAACDPAAFREWRIEAERVARAGALAAGDDEPTLGEIHARLAASRIVRDATASAEMELEAEHAVLRPVEGLRALLSRRPAGAPLIFISDTVLPGAWLAGQLARFGFRPDCQVFTSADTRRSKHTGRLFDHVAASLGRAGAEFLHLGDNPQTDVANARARGWQAEHLPRPRPSPEGEEVARAHWLRRVLSSHRRADPAHVTDPLVRSSSLLLIAFTLYVLAEARRRGISRIYFLSRDGYLPLAIARRITARRGHELELRYLHVSRQSIVVPAMADDPSALARRMAENMLDQPLERALEFIGIGREQTAGMLRALGEDPQRRYDGAGDRATMERLFAAQHDVIRAHLEKRRESALAYLEEQGFLQPGPRLVVDVGWRGGTQQALANLTRLPVGDIQGCYLGLFADALDAILNPETARGFLFSFGHPRANFDLVREGYALFELFFSAPDPTVVGYARTEGRMAPVFAPESEPGASRRRAAMAAIEEGVMAEVTALDAMLDGAWPEDIDAASALADIAPLLTAPTRSEVAAINAIPFINVLNGAHSVVPVNRLPLRRLLFRPEAALRQMENAPWRAGSVRLNLPWPLPFMAYPDLWHRYGRLRRLLRLM